MSQRNSRKEASQARKGQFLLPLAFLGIVGLSSLSYNYLRDSLIDSISNSSNSSSVKLGFEGLEASFPLKLTANAVKLDLNQSPFINLASCTAPSGGLSLLSLLTLNRSVSARADCYGGELAIELSGSVFENGSTFQVSLKDLNIGLHPLVRLLGIKGKIGTVMNGQTNSDGSQLETLNGTVSVDKVSYPGGFNYKGLIELPAIHDLVANCNVKADKQKFWLENCSGDSSLGKFDGNAQGVFSQEGLLLNGRTSISLELSDTGQKKIAPYLSLASGGIQRKSREKVENNSTNEIQWEKILNPLRNFSR